MVKSGNASDCEYASEPKFKSRVKADRVRLKFQRAFYNPRFCDMGLWDIISGAYDEPYDRYARGAHTALKLVRENVRGKYGDDWDVVRPKEARELKFHIRFMYEQGGFENYKHALARWQIFKALYPEWITDADKPVFISECWKDR